jgi:hypothetical protein
MGEYGRRAPRLSTGVANYVFDIHGHMALHIAVHGHWPHGGQTGAPFKKSKKRWTRREALPHFELRTLNLSERHSKGNPVSRAVRGESGADSATVSGKPFAQKRHW